MVHNIFRFFFNLKRGTVYLHLPGKGKISKVYVVLKLKTVIWTICKIEGNPMIQSLMWLDKHFQAIINELSSSKYPLSLCASSHSFSFYHFFD